MVQRRIPLTVYQPARAGVQAFAILAAFEAAARGVIISVFPVLLYRSLGNAQAVSEVYFGAGLVSLVVALFTPWLAGHMARRHLYTGAIVLMIASNIAAALLGTPAAPAALIGNAVALVVMTVCFNAYVMDYIDRTSMGKNETARLLYSGLAWALGPYLGVLLMDVWPQGPFWLAIFFCLGMLAFFWYLRLGDGKVITRARSKPARPLAYLKRFAVQPLLVAGWAFSCLRSVGWQVYIVYLPIFAVENGLGDQLGGLMLSFSNALLFLAPLILRFLVARSVRYAIRIGFGFSALFFFAAVGLSTLPYNEAAWATVMALFLSTIFLVVLDVAAGLPFLMSVKPSERTEMAAVYSTFRDVSAVVTPGAARLILAFGPLTAVFAATGASLLACWLAAGKLNPRLGKRRTAPA